MPRAYEPTGCKKNGLLRPVRPIAHANTELPHHHEVEGVGSPVPVSGSEDGRAVGDEWKRRLAEVLPGGVLPPLADHRGSTKMRTHKVPSEKKGNKFPRKRKRKFGTVAIGRFGNRRKGPTMPSSHESPSDTLLCGQFALKITRDSPGGESNQE